MGLSRGVGLGKGISLFRFRSKGKGGRRDGLNRGGFRGLVWVGVGDIISEKRVNFSEKGGFLRKRVGIACLSM